MSDERIMIVCSGDSYGDAKAKALRLMGQKAGDGTLVAPDAETWQPTVTAWRLDTVEAEYDDVRGGGVRGRYTFSFREAKP